MLYPLKRGVAPEDDQLMDKYEFLLAKSKEIWEESIAGGGYKKKVQDPEMTPQYKPNQPPAQLATAVAKPTSSSSNRKT